MIGIAWRGHKIEPLIEGLRFIILRVDGERPDTCDIGRLRGPQHRVVQKAGAEAFSLPFYGYRKAREQHGRDRMPSQPLGETLWSVIAFDLAEDECVVGSRAPACWLWRRGRNGLRNG